jgi:hypothetical protein
MPYRFLNLEHFSRIGDTPGQDLPPRPFRIEDFNIAKVLATIYQLNDNFLMRKLLHIVLLFARFMNLVELLRRADQIVGLLPVLFLDFLIDISGSGELEVRRVGYFDLASSDEIEVFRTVTRSIHNLPLLEALSLHMQDNLAQLALGPVFEHRKNLQDFDILPHLLSLVPC